MCDTHRLTPREIDAIRVGLRLLVDARASSPELRAARVVEDVEALLGDSRIIELIQALRMAVGVSVETPAPAIRSWTAALEGVE